MIEPTFEQTQRAAYGRWEKQGRGDGHDLFDYYEARHDLIMAMNYAEIANYPLVADKETKLGNIGASCRYCGKNKPIVTFDIRAHAIPEFMGNEALIDLNECDTCNKFFSGHLENNLSEFLLPARTMLGMAEKKGKAPSYVSKTSRIDSDGTNIQITQRPCDPIVQIDEANNKITVLMTVRTYVPIRVYKCLAKMALAIMPPAEAAYFKNTCQWILTPDHADRVGAFKGQIAYLLFVPGPNPFPVPWASLLRRRDDAALLPHMIFAIGSKNLVFQIFVPLSKMDDYLFGKQFKFPRFGLPTGPDTEFGQSTLGKMPLDSPDQVKNSSLSVEHYVGVFSHTK